MKQTIGNYRWTVCVLVFFATTVNYLDRQVLSLLQPRLEGLFGWSNVDYANITAVFQFSYAVSLLFAGSIVDKLGTKWGYAWSIIIWSIAAIIHAYAIPIGTGINSLLGWSALAAVPVSVMGFMFCRALLGLGEAGNFPAAIKATAEYFPKKERSFATGIFNSGTNVGAILAPLTVPWIADQWGWETAFFGIGAVGFIWLIFWILLYEKPEKQKRLSAAELAYINSDDINSGIVNSNDSKGGIFNSNEANSGTVKSNDPNSGNAGAGSNAINGGNGSSDAVDNNDRSADAKLVITQKVSWFKLFRYRQTWAFTFGKFMTDGVWWFFLFWLPAYLKANYGMTGSDIMIPLAVLYSMTMVGSIGGGWFPVYFIRKGYEPYDGRMRAMFMIAIIPLVVLAAQPLGYISFWVPVVLIGIGASAHQAWSANIFTTVSDMFPKKAVGSVIGIGGMAGGIGGVILTKLGGALFDHYKSFGHIETGYTIMFTICGLAYLTAWVVMKTLVPRYKPITDL